MAASHRSLKERDCKLLTGRLNRGSAVTPDSEQQFCYPRIAQKKFSKNPKSFQLQQLRTNRITELCQHVSQLRLLSPARNFCREEFWCTEGGPRFVEATEFLLASVNSDAF